MAATHPTMRSSTRNVLPIPARSNRRWGILLAVCVGAAAATSQGAVVPQPPESAAPESVTVLSVFDSNPRFGKDPFFPNSKRRESLPVVATPVVVQNSPNASLEALFGLMQLKGVSISPSRRLAIINHYTLAEGEEREIKVSGQVIKVRCVTVNEESAVINVRGRTKELKLRDGI